MKSSKISPDLIVLARPVLLPNQFSKFSYKASTEKRSASKPWTNSVAQVAAFAKKPVESSRLLNSTKHSGELGLLLPLNSGGQELAQGKHCI